jgi:hypothetical protein
MANNNSTQRVLVSHRSLFPSMGDEVLKGPKINGKHQPATLPPWGVRGSVVLLAASLAHKKPIRVQWIYWKASRQRDPTFPFFSNLHDDVLTTEI